MEFSIMASQNPWWKSPEEIERDRKISEFNSSKIKWIPALKKEFAYVDAIYTLRGPRQVGKTTLVKLIIREHLKNHAPESAFYFTCDLIQDEKDLASLIESYISFSSKIKERKLIILDEISSVKNWEIGIKYEKDIGNLDNATVILTGSHSLDIKYSSERLPGRRGEFNVRINKIMFPMSFLEYVSAIKPEIMEKIGDLPPRQEIMDYIINVEDAVEDAVKVFSMYSTEIYSLLDDYLITGGMIKAINEYYLKGDIEAPYYEMYIRSIIGDMARWRYREDILRQVLRGIVERMGSAITYNSIAKVSEIRSHNTVSKYIDALEHSFILNSIEQIEIHKKAPNPRKSRKVYFTDPFIFHAINGWIQGRVDYFDLSKEMLFNNEKKSKIIEMMVSSHLSRFVYEVINSDVFSLQNHLFFWKKGNEREVDFILKISDSLYPIEVKFRKKHTDIRVPFSKRIVLSKNKVELNRGKPTIPVAYFLLLLGI